MESTGRILCSDARRSSNGDDWEYELLIDTRRSARQTGEEHRVWVKELAPHPSVDALWESPIIGDGAEQLLRLNADPNATDGPTPDMRSAVTQIHEPVLFPGGLA
jgi:hypothetical protein